MSKALVIVAHGSMLSDSETAYQAALEIKKTGLFDEVFSLFLKKEPFLQRVFPEITAEEIIVVPLFISRGYYFTKVQTFIMKRRTNQLITCTRTPTEHPRLADIIFDLAAEAGATGNETLALLAHGSKKNSRTGDTINLQAEYMRARGKFAQVITIFLQQAPYWEEVDSLASQDKIIMVPMFFSKTWHIAEKVTQKMGIEKESWILGNKQIKNTPCLGAHSDLPQLLLDLCSEEFMPDQFGSSER